MGRYEWAVISIDLVLIFFSYSGPSGILGSGRKQTVEAGARGVRIVELFISSHEQTQ